MFALIAAILAGVGLILALIGTAIPAWLLWSVLLGIALHLVWGIAVPFRVPPRA